MEVFNLFSSGEIDKAGPIPEEFNTWWIDVEEDENLNNNFIWLNTNLHKMLLEFWLSSVIKDVNCG